MQFGLKIHGNLFVQFHVELSLQFIQSRNENNPPIIWIFEQISTPCMRGGADAKSKKLSELWLVARHLKISAFILQGGRIIK